VKLIRLGKGIGFLEKYIGFLEKYIGFLEKYIGFLEKAKFAKRDFVYVFKRWGSRPIIYILPNIYMGRGLTTPYPFCETN
jgi:hypothetical protein